MRRYLVLLEVTDNGEPDTDGAAIYTFRSASHTERWLKQQLFAARPANIHLIVRLTEELLP